MQRRRVLRSIGGITAGGLAGCLGGQPGSPGDGNDEGADAPSGDEPSGDGPNGDGSGGDGTTGDEPTGDGSDDDGPSGDGTNGDGPDDDGPDGSPADPATSFTVGATRCGTQVNRADVTFGDGTVTVEGTTWGNDACYTGRLESATLEDDVLTVRVVAESAADDSRGCAECISEIDYRLTVETTSTPEEVVVVHRGETVATARP